ncbi:MAG TPA: nuclear transport factor 2 family protein [Holophagaceae bacterium]|nr:nuclear transport factor 2 family protein [Holophagaceae bacterium]
MLPLVLPTLLAFAGSADDGTLGFTQARLRAMNAHDVSAVVDFYESGAESVGPDGRSSKGPDALRAAWQARFGVPSKVEVKDVTYVASPNEVFVYGLLETDPAGGKPVVERFSELRVRLHGRWFVRFESRQPVAP